MRRRSFVHRVTALLSSALLLQLSLLAGGTRCPMHDGHDAAASAHNEAAAHAGHASGISATDAQSVVSVAEQSSGAPDAGCNHVATGASCNAPWSTSGCASMSACAALSSMAPAASSSVEIAAIHAARFVASAAIPLGPAFAPELPPPRA